MLKTRIASGAVLAPLFLALVYFGSPYFDMLVAASAGVMAWEFARMDGRAGGFWTGVLAVSAVAAAGTSTVAIPVFGLGIIVAVSVGFLAVEGFGRGAGPRLAHLALLYAALPALALLYVQGHGGRLSVYWIVAVVWATDIGAYAFGRMIGGPKLAPAISPNKTWAGAIGGLASAILAAGILLSSLGIAPSAKLAALAALASIMSQGGDLFESAIKRHYQVKDSGGLIPGHGGVMDRFDGLWAAAPVAALFCAIFGGGIQQW